MLQIGEQYAQKETQQFKFCISPDHLTLWRTDISGFTTESA
jgi:hypothetical protein